MTLEYFPAYRCEGCNILCGDPTKNKDGHDANKDAVARGWMLGIILQKNLCPTCYKEACDMLHAQAKFDGKSGDNK
jgi:hypothetical protein